MRHFPVIFLMMRSTIYVDDETSIGGDTSIYIYIDDEIYIDFETSINYEISIDNLLILRSLNKIQD